MKERNRVLPASTQPRCRQGSFNVKARWLWAPEDWKGHQCRKLLRGRVVLPGMGAVSASSASSASSAPPSDHVGRKKEAFSTQPAGTMELFGWKGCDPTHSWEPAERSDREDHPPPSPLLPSSVPPRGETYTHSHTHTVTRQVR